MRDLGLIDPHECRGFALGEFALFDHVRNGMRELGLRESFVRIRETQIREDVAAATSHRNWFRGGRFAALHCSSCVP